MAKTNNNIKSKLIFGKRNYQLMLLGLAFIAVGFFLMMGPDANTRPDGTFDPNYFNDGIFSFKRIRLAPTLVIIGFVIEVFAIMINPDKK